MMLFLANVFGWIMAHLRLVITIAVIIAVLIIVGLIYRACHKGPKLDEKAIQKAQQAIAVEDRKQMIAILAESDVKEQGIDNSIKAAENATEQSKKSYADKTNQELADELNRRAKE